MRNLLLALECTHPGHISHRQSTVDLVRDARVRSIGAGKEAIDRSTRRIEGKRLRHRSAKGCTVNDREGLPTDRYRQVQADCRISPPEIGN